MFRSLRSTLIFPWLFVAFVCCALTFQLHGLLQLGIGGEIGKVKDAVKDFRRTDQARTWPLFEWVLCGSGEL